MNSGDVRLLIIVLAVILVPQCLVIMIVGSCFRSRTHPYAWLIAYSLTLVWCGIACWEALNILGLGGVHGPDSGWVGMEILFLRLPRWLALLAPSYTALVMLRRMRPSLETPAGHWRSLRGRVRFALTGGKYRLYIWGALLVSIAALARVLSWSLFRP